MRIVYISLPTVGAVQEFVISISPLDGNFDLLSGGYILDAKSLMGIIGLDLAKPLKLAVAKDTPETMQVLSRFIIEPSHHASESHSPEERAVTTCISPIVNGGY